MEVRERGAVAGFLAGYSSNTPLGYTTDLRLFAAWCADNRLRLLEVDALIWRRSPGPWSKTVGCTQRWRAACRHCAASTATATTKGSWPGTRPPTGADRRWTPSPGHWPWTATNSVPSLVQAASGRLAITPSSRCWP
jgi:hypothetical protein